MAFLRPVFVDSVFESINFSEGLVMIFSAREL